MTVSATRSMYQELAAQLWASTQERKPVEPLSARHPELTLADAYEVQRELRAMEVADGAKLVGYKIGVTSEAMQKAFAIDHPDFGHLTDRMLLPDGACLDAARFIAPKVEAEIAFRVGEDLRGGSVTAADVLDATLAVRPVLEVLDSRIADWRIKLVDTVADNTSSAMVVVGPEVPFGPAERVDLAAEHLIFQTGERTQTAYGSAVMGHPAESVAFLVRILDTFGEGIGAGDLVLAGSWAEAVDLVPGLAVEASFAALGSVSLTVGESAGGCAEAEAAGA
ncbi:2-keto-4-pentenoate hydratase [Streptomyces camponoticapitis]|uniref:2-keto-4-pentenoate hydratase n=1 Tax=Streptomyces camponoticapitis TaxID=1616125 RepID=A0ABQ2EWZ3_9ACTN|nr:fumarylacetoacetate hydrolase family protein [Streptomyces camponoticapitis]GGK29928.1 2-keto-4-pentenoate hydratase [Streptomyces camponoticapitis]